MKNTIGNTMKQNKEALKRMAEIVEKIKKKKDINKQMKYVRATYINQCSNIERY